MSNSHGRPRRFGAGKALISLVAAETAVGPYLADWNETHICTPTWPPHAKFHNGQTMSLGAGLPGRESCRPARDSDLPPAEVRPRRTTDQSRRWSI
jgi:hypothetical protein